MNHMKLNRSSDGPRSPLDRRGDVVAQTVAIHGVLFQAWDDGQITVDAVRSREVLGWERVTVASADLRTLEDAILVRDHGGGWVVRCHEVAASAWGDGRVGLQETDRSGGGPGPDGAQGP